MRKYVFVINPAAGQGGHNEPLGRDIPRAFEGKPYDIYRTSGPGDAMKFVMEYPRDGSVCFVSCGGDGTLSETATGLMNRNKDHTGGEPDCLSCLPCGSGNDFIRNFTSSPEPWTPANLQNPYTTVIDVYRVNGRYGCNICNFGFDARVASDMVRFKRWKGVSGSAAYNLAVVSSLLRPLGQRYTIHVDGQALPPETLLLGVAANGTSYGGGFTPAPMAQTGDGRLEFIFIRKMSRLTIGAFIGAYKRGTHLTEPKMIPYIAAASGQTMEITSDKPITYSIDGDVFSSDKLTVELIPSALNFLLPR